MKLVHNTRLSAVGGSKSDKMKDQWEKNPRQFKTGAEATKKALLRAKQLKDQQRHDLVHATSLGLFACIKKTWFCRRCLVKGTTRQITEKACEPDEWAWKKANWWLGLAGPHRQALSKACDMTEQQVEEYTDRATIVVQNARPRKDVQSEATRRKAAARKAQWRIDEGYTAEPAALPGKLNASLQMPRLNLKTSSRGGGIRKRPAAAVNAEVEESSPRNGPGSWQRDLTEEGVERQPGPQKGGWVRDLTQEGVEPNPGPSQGSRRRRCSARQGVGRLLFWQLNIASWRQRGWDLLLAAEASRVDVLFLQETRLTNSEATSINASLKGWSFFHEESLATERGNNEGGVGILVRKGLPAVKSASFQSEEGQWLRVTLPDLHVTSVYRKQRSNQCLEAFNHGLCQDLACLGRVASLALGDFNKDPLVDPLNILAAGFQGSILYPCLKTGDSDSEELREETPDAMPAPTRWETGNCIDWGITSNVQASVNLDSTRWSDHKLLQWSVSYDRVSTWRAKKLKTTSDLRKPEGLEQQEWQQLVEEQWRRLSPQLSTDVSWDWSQLSRAAEEALRAAHQEYGSNTRCTGRNYKGREATFVPVCRHHRTCPAGVPRVRTSRLRRFGRRLEHWHRHPDASLKRNIMREASYFRCPFDPCDLSALPAVRDWLKLELEASEHSQQAKRLQAWKKALNEDDGAVWKWLAKPKQGNPACGLRDAKGAVLNPEDTVKAVESFWRKHWPQAHGLQEKLATLEQLHDPGNSARGGNLHLPPVSREDLLRVLRKQKSKAAGPDGWWPQELLSWPVQALDHLACILNAVEEGASWPVPLTQWRQVHVAKPGKPPGALDSLRPISVGAAAYRAWSAVRTRQVGKWIVRHLPDSVHGGLPGRGVHTALLEPLVELEQNQRNPRRGLKYVGASDLSKAFDCLHGELSVAALRRFRVPEKLCRAWGQAWERQSRVLQLGSFCSPVAVTKVFALPQGDPASPLGLTGPLCEALQRISLTYSNPAHGRTLHRIFLDDRSWFCELRRTCLDIGRDWKHEMSLLGLGENRSKADFAVNGTAKERTQMQNELFRRGQVGEVRLRPRLLGTCLQTNRKHGTPSTSETSSLTKAKKAADWACFMPGNQGRKIKFIKQTAVAVMAAPSYVRLENLRELDKLQTKVANAYRSSGHNRHGLLHRLLDGHAASTRFRHGVVATTEVLKQCHSPAVAQAWGGTRANGPVSLARRWLKRHGWVEVAAWLWRHPLTLCTLAAQPQAGARSVQLGLGCGGRLGHELREAWRAVTWQAWFKLDRARNRFLRPLPWDHLSGRLKALQSARASLPLHLTAHGTAICTGHAVSEAAWKVMNGQAIAPCTRCGAPVPDLQHALWACPAHCATRVGPRDELERQLCWPLLAATSEKEKLRARSLLMHGALVRQCLLDARLSSERLI